MEIPSLTLLGPDLIRLHADENDGGLPARIEIVLFLLDPLNVFRQCRDETSHGDVLGTDFDVGAVRHNRHALDPCCLAEQHDRTGTEAAILGAPQIAQHDDQGYGEEGERCNECAADDAVLPKAGLLLAAFILLGRLDILVLGRAEGVAFLDNLGIGHELLGPLDGTGANTEDAEAKRQSKREVLVADFTEDGDVNIDVGIDGDVGHHEQDHHDHGQDEEGGYLALCASSRLRINVTAPGAVGDISSGQPTGTPEEWASKVVGPLGVGVVPVVRGPSTVACREVAHRALIPIQTASPMKAPITPTQRKSPSATGPMRPSAIPPGLGACWRSMT